MRMHNPPHPGLTLRDDVLPALGVQIGTAADQLDVSRQALSAVLNGRAAITPDMAVRIERWLGVERGGSADVWLAQQAQFDLWQARHREPPVVVEMFMPRLMKKMVAQRVPLAAPRIAAKRSAGSMKKSASRTMVRASKARKG